MLKAWWPICIPFLNGWTFIGGLWTKCASALKHSESSSGGVALYLILSVLILLSSELQRAFREVGRLGRNEWQKTR